MVRSRSDDEGADHLIGGVDVPEGVIVATEEKVVPGMQRHVSRMV